MRKIDLGQVITILANLGVIAGIVFLAFELQQNNEALNLQARLEREDVLRRGLTRRLENPELIRAAAKAASGEQLSAEEELMLADYNQAMLVDWWLAYRQVRDGALSENSMPVTLWRSVFQDYPRTNESWAEFKSSFPLETEYIQWFEANIVNER